jgi:hypothetical protein
MTILTLIPYLNGDQDPSIKNFNDYENVLLFLQNSLCRSLKDQDSLVIYYKIHMRNKGMFESLTRQVFPWESAAVFSARIWLACGTSLWFYFQQPITKGEHKQFI